MFLFACKSPTPSRDPPAFWNHDVPLGLRIAQGIPRTNTVSMPVAPRACPPFMPVVARASAPPRARRAGAIGMASRQEVRR